MKVEACAGGVTLTAEVIPMGSDLCVAVMGGDLPHLGCAALAIPHPGISDPYAPSATVSTINLPAHRDDRLADWLAKELASALAQPVAVVCGVHFNCFSPELAAAAEQTVKELCREILKQLGK